MGSLVLRHLCFTLILLSIVACTDEPKVVTKGTAAFETEPDTDKSTLATLRGLVRLNAVKSAKRFERQTEDDGVEGATIEIVFEGIAIATTTSTEGGRWEIDGLEPGTYSVRAWYKTESGTFSFTSDSIVVVSSAEIDLGALMLELTGAIKGQVVLEDKGDWSGIFVYIPGTSFVAITGVDGRFLLLYVPPGEWGLNASKTDYVKYVTDSVTVIAGQTTALPKPIVLDPDGPTVQDADKDGIVDALDNCLYTPNNSQLDNDLDNYGDACDVDDDNDLVSDSVDNCPIVVNADQENLDADSKGDACDDDIDGDGLANAIDVFPYDPDEWLDTDADGYGDSGDVFPLDVDEWSDGDSDGVGNNADNCPGIANTGQFDQDGDLAGDACDADDDNDGIADGYDNCPLVANLSQFDQDADDIGNACDDDIDGDTYPNEDDAFPTDAGEWADGDGDGRGDIGDAFPGDPGEWADGDSDGVGDNSDNCRWDSNGDQLNFDGDSLGNVCDDDMDGDGYSNADEAVAGTEPLDVANYPSPPTVAITSAPSMTSSTDAAVFHFTSTSPLTTSYICSLNGSAPAACESPKAYANLAESTNRFQVHAVDSIGVTSETVVWDWTVRLHWTRVDGAVNSFCGMKSDSKPWCWGETAGDAPVRYGGGVTYIAMLSGPYGSRTCGLKGDHTIACVGASTTAGWVDIGYSGALWTQTFACGIYHDSTLWCWGDNAYGQLGQGNYDSYPSAVSIGGNGWQDIHVGYRASCGIRNGELYCWGQSTTANVIKIGSASNWSEIDGYQNTDSRFFALQDDGKLWQISAAGSETQVGTDLWLKADAGSGHVCGIKLSDKSMQCWGGNSSGQVATGTIGEPGDEWVAVGLSDATSCGIKSDGTLWCWGDNAYGELGIDAASGPELCTYPCSRVPVLVGPK